MKSIPAQSIVSKISSRRALITFGRAVWHLRSLFSTLLGFFLALCGVMYRWGGPVDLLTHARVSFGETVYFCSVTALTIGYGDIVPTTAVGRIVAVLLGLLGVLITGLTTAVAVYGVQCAAGRQTSAASKS